MGFGLTLSPLLKMNGMYDHYMNILDLLDGQLKSSGLSQVETGLSHQIENRPSISHLPSVEIYA